MPTAYLGRIATGNPGSDPIGINPRSNIVINAMENDSEICFVFRTLRARNLLANLGLYPLARASGPVTRSDFRLYFILNIMAFPDPGNFNPVNTVECLGGGGGHFVGASPTAAFVGGGGGAYAIRHNVPITFPINVSVGTGGTQSAGGDSFLGPTGARLCSAQGGGGQTLGGAGGSAVSPAGFRGGNGSLVAGSGGFGGGAAGPNGQGGDATQTAPGGGNGAWDLLASGTGGSTPPGTQPSGYGAGSGGQYYVSYIAQHPNTQGTPGAVIITYAPQYPPHTQRGIVCA